MKAYLIATALFIIGTTATAQTAYTETATNETYETSGMLAAKGPAQGATGIPAVIEEEAIKLYPTQCINTLMVDNNKAGQLDYRIVTFDGREVSNGALRPQGTTRINVGGYPAGMYFLFVTGDRQAGAYKFMKI